ncbi:MFS transporter [soil metagenome]
MSDTLTIGRPDSSEASLYRKVELRLIPFLFVCYLVAYLDRVNVGFAKLQMVGELKFSETVYGLGAGLFFIGYFLFEVPSNVILARVGPRRWIARIMISWGLLSAAMMFVESATSFYVLRFLLGIAEAGFFPGIILYLTYWFPQDRRGRIVALFMTAVGVSGIVGGPVSGWILAEMSGVQGLSGWKWLFLLEGLPSVLLGIATFFYLDDSIVAARWLDPAEKSLLQKRVDHGKPRDARKSTIAEVVKDPRVWLYAGIYFCFVMGLYGVGFWLPNLIKAAGVAKPLDIGLLSAVPYIVGAIAMVLIGKHSDKTGERHGHLIVLALVGAVGFLISSLFPDSLVLALGGITVATVAILSAVSLSWSLPTAYLSVAAAAAGIAMVNSLGNLAGFVSPYLVGWIKDATQSLSGGLYALAASFVIGAVLVWIDRSLPAPS